MSFWKTLAERLGSAKLQLKNWFRCALIAFWDKVYLMHAPLSAVSQPLYHRCHGKRDITRLDSVAAPRPLQQGTSAAMRQCSLGFVIPGAQEPS